jgi:type I restriction enzyme S subunit
VSGIPATWVRSTLSSVCTKGQYGWTTRATDQGAVKFLRTTDITKGPIDWNSVPYCLEVPPAVDRYLLQPNDILISRAGSVGFSSLIRDIPTPAVFASYLIRFIPLEGVSPRYVAYFLLSDNYWGQIGAASAGIALANVNAAKLANVELPVAPLHEQRRIAEKLDCVIAKVDASRERLERVPRILKTFREAVLEAAVSGRLTEKWRGAQGAGVSGQELVLSAVALHHNSKRGHAPTQKQRSEKPKIGKEKLEPIRDVPSSWGWISAADVVEPGADIVYGIVQPGPKLAEGVPYV